MLWKPWETTTEGEDNAAQGPALRGTVQGSAGVAGWGPERGRPGKPRASGGGSTIRRSRPWRSESQA